MDLRELQARIPGMMRHLASYTVIPFYVTISESQRKPMRRGYSVILMLKCPGILAWRLLAANSGKGMDSSFQTQSSWLHLSTRNEQDKVQRSWKKRCEMSSSKRDKDSLYKAWSEWLKPAGENRGSRRTKKWLTSSDDNRGS